VFHRCEHSRSPIYFDVLKIYIFIERPVRFTQATMRLLSGLKLSSPGLELRVGAPGLSTRGLSKCTNIAERLVSVKAGCLLSSRRYEYR
jgi:hypothetical protein